MTTWTKYGLAVLAIVIGLTIPLFACAEVCPQALSVYHSPTKSQQAACESVSKVARAYDVPQAIAVAVARTESDFRIGAISHAGAFGPMQIKPQYYCPKRFGMPLCIGWRELVEGGVAHLAELLDDYDTPTALAAYNAGRRGALELGRGRGYAATVLRRARGLR